MTTPAPVRRAATPTASLRGATPLASAPSKRHEKSKREHNLRSHAAAGGRAVKSGTKLTREGKFFAGITAGVGFAAINTGNNLLYLLLGMLLALIVVSLFMSEVSLRGLTVVRRLPVRAQVGNPHVVEIEVFNHKLNVPSYAIEVEDLRANLPADKRCFFLKISPNSAQIAAYRRTPAKRGRDLHVGFRLATRFPFGLFERSRELPAAGELVIYPGIDPVALATPVAGRTIGTEPLMGQGAGEDFVGLKPMREGEDPRHIHWRKSASLGQLVVRERAIDLRPDIYLTLDVRAPATVTTEWTVSFERRIRELASRSVAHIKRGDFVRLASSAGTTLRGDRNTGADSILRYLALVEAEPEGGAQPAHETSSPKGST